MKSLGNKIVVELEKEQDDEIQTESGVKLYIDTGFQNYAHARKYGTIKASNKLLRKFGAVEGRRVYISPRCVQDSTIKHAYKSLKILPDKKLYSAIFPSQVFLLENENGKLEAQGDIVLGKRIEEDNKTESGIFLTGEPIVDKNKIVVTHVSKSVSNKGVEVGDTLFIDGNAAYELEVEGETLYVVNYRYLYAKVKDNKLHPLDEVLFAKEQKKKVLASEISQNKAIVLSSGVDNIKAGDCVYYIKKSFQEVEFNKQSLLVLLKSNILGYDE